MVLSSILWRCNYFDSQLWDKQSNQRLRWKIELIIKNFFLGFQHLPEEEIYDTSIRQKTLIVCCVTHILSNKDTLHKVSPTFLWKTRTSRLQLFCRTVVLKIIEDFQKNIGGGVQFEWISLVCYSENWCFTWNNTA